MQERQVWIQEVTSPSKDIKDMDRVSIKSYLVFRYQNIIKNTMVQRGGNTTRSGKQGDNCRKISPKVRVTSPQEQSLTNEEIERMFFKGAIVEMPPEEADQGFYSSLFLVPKKDRGRMPVINVESLNKYVVPHHFKMQRFHTLKDLLKRNDWMMNVD